MPPGKLHIKVMPNTPDEFLKKALDMIRRGKNCIVFVNEDFLMLVTNEVLIYIFLFV